MRRICGFRTRPRGARRIAAEVEWVFEPRDLWIGLYWKRYPGAIEFYLGLIPLLPIRLYFQRFD